MRLASILLGFVLTGCTHLDPHSPASVDLSGTWQLDPRASDSAPLLVEHAHADDDERPHANGEPPRFAGPSPLLPMVTAEQMTISQDAESMGIAYPNQPYRDVKWGRQKRSLYTVDAGW